MEMAGRDGARVAGALLGLMALAAVASPLAAQGSDPCQPPAGDTGFAEVRADVFAGTFDRVLPFDVPLRLCAKVPQGTKGMEVKVAEGRRKLALDDASCVVPPAIDPWGPAIPGRVDDLSFPTVTTARVVVPRLDAQRYYSFCFILNRPLTPEEMQKLRPEVREILDRELQTITSGDVGAAALQRHEQHVRDELARRMLAVTGAEQVASGLDELVQGVLAPQLRTRLIQQGGLADGTGPSPAGLAQLQSKLSAALDGVRDSGALARFIAALQQEARTNAVLRDLLDQTYAPALRLAALSDAQSMAVATGQDPNAPPAAATLASTTRLAVAGAAAQNFDATNQALTGLRGLIATMTGPGGPPPVQAALTPADRAELAALVAPGGAIAKAEDLTFTLSGEAQRLADALAAREKALADFASQLDLAMRGIFLVDGSSTGNFDTFSNYYISADAGLLWSSEVDQVVPYVGTNIYLRPVNKNAPLRTLGGFGHTFSRRFAFTLGLTAESVADTGQRHHRRDPRRPVRQPVAARRRRPAPDRHDPRRRRRPGVQAEGPQPADRPPDDRPRALLLGLLRPQRRPRLPRRLGRPARRRQ